jgi:hypothetical protein
MWVVSTTLRLLYPQEKPGTYCTGGCVVIGAGLNDMENLAPSGIPSPNHPAAMSLSTIL